MVQALEILAHPSLVVAQPSSEPTLYIPSAPALASDNPIESLYRHKRFWFRESWTMH